MNNLIRLDDVIEAVHKFVKYIEELPRAGTDNFVWDKWCTDCKEYDHEKHCCPRFNCVIKKAVEEVKEMQQLEQQWVPLSKRLPKEEKMDYWVCTNTGYQCQCRWTNDIYGLGESDRWGWKIFDIPQYQKVVAWMPFLLFGVRTADGTKPCFVKWIGGQILLLFI